MQVHVLAVAVDLEGRGPTGIVQGAVECNMGGGVAKPKPKSSTNAGPAPKPPISNLPPPGGGA